MPIGRAGGRLSRSHVPGLPPLSPLARGASRTGVGASFMPPACWAGYHLELACSLSRPSRSCHTPNRRAPNWCRGLIHAARLLAVRPSRPCLSLTSHSLFPCFAAFTFSFSWTSFSPENGSFSLLVVRSQRMGDSSENGVFIPGGEPIHDGLSGREGIRPFQRCTGFHKFLSSEHFTQCAPSIIRSQECMCLSRTLREKR